MACEARAVGDEFVNMAMQRQKRFARHDEAHEYCSPTAEDHRGTDPDRQWCEADILLQVLFDPRPDLACDGDGDMRPMGGARARQTGVGKELPLSTDLGLGVVVEEQLNRLNHGEQ